MIHLMVENIGIKFELKILTWIFQRYTVISGLGRGGAILDFYENQLIKF